MAFLFVHLELVDFWSSVVRSCRSELADARWALVSADERVLAVSRSCRSFGLRPGIRLEDAKNIVRTLRPISLSPRLLQQEIDAFESIVVSAVAPSGGGIEMVRPGQARIRFDGVSDIEVQVRIEEAVSHLEERFSGIVRAGIGAEKFLARQACSDLSAGVSILGPEDFLTRCGDRPFSIIPGIPPEVRRELWAFGLRTVEDLAKTDPSSLRTYFGDEVDVWIARAQGKSAEEISRSQEISAEDFSVDESRGPRILESLEFGENSQRRGVVRRRLERAARGMEAKVKELGRLSWEQNLRVTWMDGTETSVRTPDMGSRPADLSTAFLSLFRSFDLGGVIERIDLTAGKLRPRVALAALGSLRPPLRTNPAAQAKTQQKAPEPLPLFRELASEIGPDLRAS